MGYSLLGLDGEHSYLDIGTVFPRMYIVIGIIRDSDIQAWVPLLPIFGDVWLMQINSSFTGRRNTIQINTDLKQVYFTLY